MKNLWQVGIYIFLTIILAGCGELTFHLHPAPTNENDDVKLKVGDEIVAITQSDCVSIGGGYFPSITSDNIDVVQPVNIKTPCGHKVFLKAIKKGKATMCYIPIYRIGKQTKNAKLDDCERKFRVIIE
ncbi:hypothetical protein [Sulfurovum mangrovi]|uniref:hypothetical protein n=1 Tax=Sulfurovum mangrovi TaxID=2893889 RepID=UPI001E378031|nr:hypothetical protein [Sulfurovum mangrovi]UFH58129.1 hypothetical protein LN246_07170 [Sulfurovum mangrovi]